METKNIKKEKQDMDNDVGIVRFLRDVPPAHYILKIESLSLFLTTKNENYESRAFEAGGYKWKLSLYPNGNKKRNVNGHISLYLAIANPNTLPLGWEVIVDLKFCVFNHIQDKYLTIQEHGFRRFRLTKTECGFDELLSLDTFNDASNGYLIDDCCIFGAEVFVINYNSKGECLSTVKYPVNNTHTWKVNHFSAINQESVSSKEFLIGGCKWNLSFYPKGDLRTNGESLLLFLNLANSKTLPSESKVYAEYILRIKDQITGKHFEKQGGAWFCALNESWGFFLSLSDLNDASKGFLVNDAVTIEAQINQISTLKDF